MVDVDKKIKTLAVVTPCRNAEKYLAETIDSVINQKGDFFIDYVVVDCCSSDATLSILERYKKLVEADSVRCCLGVTFRYLSESDAGMYDGLAKGFKMVKGEVACYINSDDFYLPNAFQTVLDQFENPDVRWLTGLPCLYSASGVIQPSMTPCLYRSKLIRKGAYGRVLPHIQQESTFWVFELLDLIDFDRLSELKMAGDFYLWWNFAETEQLVTLNALVSGFRMHTGNMSNQSDAYYIELDQIAEGNISLVDRVYLLGLKIAFKIFGNKVVSLGKSVIDVEI